MVLEPCFISCVYYIIMCQSGWSSLIVASRNGHVEVVEKLLQHGATVDLLHEVLSIFTSYATIPFCTMFTLFFLPLPICI